MAFSREAGPVAFKCPQCGAGLSPSAEGYTICQYCGSNLIWSQRGPGTGGAAGKVIRGIRFKMFTYTDSQGTGLELFRMLAPVGWKFEGGCKWLLDNPGMPATVAFHLWNPDGAQAFEVLPNMNFVWTNNPMARLTARTGSRYFGAEVRPPVSICQAMRELVLPRCRSTMRNLKILNEGPVPELPQLAKSEAPLVGGSAESGKVRIRYEWQGRQFDEEIYGIVEVFRVPIASMFGPVETIYWWVDFIFSFRAAAGQLEANVELFKAIIESFQLNPQWYAAYKSLVQALAQMQIQRIHHIGQVGQIIAQTGREIREQNLRDWYARQDSWDRRSTEWSRAMRGVDGFYDPHREEVVELPSGYGHAWANNLGEYIVTEDPNFNPNIYSNLHWEPMQQG